MDLTETTVNSFLKGLLLVSIGFIIASLRSKRPSESLFIYLQKFFKNDLSKEDKQKILYGINLLYSKKLDDCTVFFKNNSFENYSDYFIAMISVMEKKKINGDISLVLEEILSNNKIEFGFGDIYYLLAKVNRDYDPNKYNTFRQKFIEGEKCLFKDQKI